MSKKESKLIKAVRINNYKKVLKIFYKLDREQSKGKPKDVLDINKTDSNGYAPIHYAAQGGSYEILKLLLSKGALVDNIDQHGRRPISYVCLYNQLGLLKYLLTDAASNPNLVDIRKETDSPLHLAASRGHYDIASLLLDHNAQIQCNNSQGKTPLDIACENNQYQIVSLLLERTNKIIEQAANDLGKENRTMNRSSISYNDISPLSNTPSNRYTFNSFTSCSTSPTTPTSIKSPINSPLYTMNHQTKSNSLNTVFLTDLNNNNNNNNNNNSSIDYFKMMNKNFNNNDNNNEDEIINKENRSDIETMQIMLPYPTTFSPNGNMHLKSPIVTPRNVGLINNAQPAKSQRYLMRNSTINSDNAILPNRQYIKKANTVNFSPAARFNSNAGNSKNFQQPQTCPPFYNPVHKRNTYKHNGSVSDITNQMSPTDIHDNSQGYITSNINSITHYNSENNIMASPTKVNSDLVDKPSSNFKKSNFSSIDDLNCRQWLQNILLESIWTRLEELGFDSFLALSLASLSEIGLICNNNHETVSRLNRAIRVLKIPKLDQLEFSSKISQLLIQLGLEQYEEDFLNNGYTSVETLKEFSVSDLDKMRITKKGHRRLLLSVIRCQMGKIAKTSLSNMLQEIPTPRPINQSNYNSLPRMRHSIDQYMINTVNNKGPRPPIPPRSCSLVESSSNINCNTNCTTLEELLTSESNNNKKKSTDDINDLEDVLTILSNLGKQIDRELGNRKY